MKRSFPEAHFTDRIGENWKFPLLSVFIQGRNPTRDESTHMFNPKSPRTQSMRTSPVRLAMFGFAVSVGVLCASPALAQTDGELKAAGEKCAAEKRTQCPEDTRATTIAAAPATNPNPVILFPVNAAPVTQPIATANVAGVTVTTAAPTTAAVTTLKPAAVVLVPSTAQVLGVTIEEQAEDVAFTGSESGRYTALGLILTSIGASLIAVSRSRRRKA